MEYLLEAREITKRFTHHLALDQVSVSIPNNSIFGLLGPNGAGKTTLIRIINQIIAPDKGEVFFDGIPLQPAHVARIGYLPEERGLYKKMKVGEQAVYLAQLKGLSKPEAIKRLKEWFEKFDISAWWNKKVEELSKGMQQKIQFIVTILHEPELLIFDEPFSGFDPINVNILREEILELKKKGCTIIFSTHNMASVEEICDHIVLIDRAHKILEGNVVEIKEKNKEHIFEIGYQNPKGPIENILGNGFQVLSNDFRSNRFVARVKLPEGHQQNHLLEKMIPSTEILSFTEEYPSMNDIFIRHVNENLKGNRKQ